MKTFKITFYGRLNRGFWSRKLEEDVKLLLERGLEQLKQDGCYGVIDRLTTSGLIL